jgi:DNA repair protein RadC
MRLKNLSSIDLPREKLQKYGTAKLKDFELLALLLGSGIKGLNVLELSKKVLQKAKKIGLGNITLEDLLEIKGLGVAKALQIIAVLELGNRFTQNDKAEILTAKDIWLLCSDIKDFKKEHFLAFYLDTQNRLIQRQIISVGTLDASLVHPREVFEPALALHASSIIIAHNHPSNNVDPSVEDREVTQRLKQAGELLGIDLQDHIIIGSKDFCSLKNAKML